MFGVHVCANCMSQNSPQAPLGGRGCCCWTLLGVIRLIPGAIGCDDQCYSCKEEAESEERHAKEAGRDGCSRQRRTVQAQSLFTLLVRRALNDSSARLDPDQAGGNVLDEVLDLDTADSASEDVHGRLSSHGHGGRKGHKPPAQHQQQQDYDEYEDEEGMEQDDDETWHATPKVPQPRTPTPTQMAQRSITTDGTPRSRTNATPAGSVPLNNRSASTPSQAQSSP